MSLNEKSSYAPEVSGEEVIIRGEDMNLSVATVWMRFMEVLILIADAIFLLLLLLSPESLVSIPRDLLRIEDANVITAVVDVSNALDYMEKFYGIHAVPKKIRSNNKHIGREGFIISTKRI